MVGVLSSIVSTRNAEEILLGDGTQERKKVLTLRWFTHSMAALLLGVPVTQVLFLQERAIVPTLV
jgi:hypothetical protein